MNDRFELYCRLLRKLTKTTDAHERQEIIDGLKIIRAGLLPIRFCGGNYEKGKNL